MDDSNAVGGSAVGGRELTVPEAARVLGISERAIRWRISSGTISATRKGRSWLVHVPLDASAVVESGSPSGSAVVDSGSAVVDAVMAEWRRGSNAVVELARQLDESNAHIRDRDRTIMELAGQVGYLQAELTQARQQLALAAPIDDAPGVVQTEKPPWWRRLFR